MNAEPFSFSIVAADVPVEGRRYRIEADEEQRRGLAELLDIPAVESLTAELEKAIKQTKAQFAYSSESVTHQGYWLGFSQVVASLSWLDQWLEQLTAVTASDVQRVAQQYFVPHRQTVGWYIPE